jgi:hypothetical protein
MTCNAGASPAADLSCLHQHPDEAACPNRARLGATHAPRRSTCTDPLIYSHVTPYGTFRLDMNQRLAIEQDAAAA